MKAIPEPTLRRLPKYLHLLMEWRNNNINYVSSQAIADELGLDAIQVRKDLSVTGIVGKPKVGFDLRELIRALCSTLNWNNVSEAFIIGTGSLGSALLGYKKFNDYGLNIIAAFDNDSEKLGTKVNGIEIFPIEKLEIMITQLKINVAVLTVPGDVAQALAEKLVSYGIKAIWNFAPIHLKVPDSVIVENAQLSHSLAILTHRLSKANLT